MSRNPKQRGLLAFKKINQSTQEVKISMLFNLDKTVLIFSMFCLPQSGRRIEENDDNLRTYLNVSESLPKFLPCGDKVCKSNLLFILFCFGGFCVDFPVCLVSY